MGSVKHDTSLHYNCLPGAHSAVATATPDYSSQQICQPSRGVEPPASIITVSRVQLYNVRQTLWY